MLGTFGGKENQLLSCYNLQELICLQLSVHST